MNLVLDRRPQDRRACAFGIRSLRAVCNHFVEADNFVKDDAPEWFSDEVATPAGWSGDP
jgi:hypothetical protein